MTDVTLDEILRGILTPIAPHDAPTASELLFAIESDARSFARPIDVALVHAARADRLGYAFAAGYTAATRTLVRGRALSLGPRPRLSLAATEEGGAHPRAIATSFAPALNGKKIYSTLAAEATHLVVIARDGEAAGRPRLRAVIVPRDREGVSVTTMPETPFCPEIRHAVVTLTDVSYEASEVLGGDAFVEVLKPFRTIEDLCVQASLVAWLGATSQRARLDRTLAARAASLAVTTRELADLDPSSSVTHVALGGLLSCTADLAARFEAEVQERGPQDLREQYLRDKPLLDIAGRARSERLARAWERLVTLERPER